MQLSGALQQTLIGRLWPEGNVTTFRWGILILVGSLFLAACAQITVWTVPVPITMQTFGVLVVGAVYGWRLGLATVAAYLVEGAIGLPFFAGMTGGLAILFGPTGGYLFGFVAAAAVVGWLAERGWDRNILTMALAMLIGNVVLYVPGIVWLSNFTGWEKVFDYGLYPFVIGDAVKLAAAALLLPAAWQFMRRG
ncbi:MAG TPA: biotin transporter BioY [Verrucomicrobiae bacterium]|nr:biotin transporter BioY [Verrucomicrobiae bacterium]